MIIMMVIKLNVKMIIVIIILLLKLCERKNNTNAADD